MDTAYFVLADAAQVVDGKLYLLGGGWDRIWVAKFPTKHPFTICTGIRVPWDRTNLQHAVKIVIENADGKTLAEIAGNLEVGKPAGLAAGSSQLINLAFPQVLEIDQPGRFRARAYIDDAIVGELTFSAVPRQPAL